MRRAGLRADGALLLQGGQPPEGLEGERKWEPCPQEARPEVRMPG